MDRLAESQLLNFCANQKKRFDAAGWDAAPGVPRDRLSLVALLLASTRWYGHQDALLEVARRLNPESVTDAPSLVERLNFDCSRFYHSLQAKLEHEDGS